MSLPLCKLTVEQLTMMKGLPVFYYAPHLQGWVIFAGVEETNDGRHLLYWRGVKDKGAMPHWDANLYAHDSSVSGFYLGNPHL